MKTNDDKTTLYLHPDRCPELVPMPHVSLREGDGGVSHTLLAEPGERYPVQVIYDPVEHWSADLNFLATFFLGAPVFGEAWIAGPAGRPVPDHLVELALRIWVRGHVKGRVGEGKVAIIEVTHGDGKVATFLVAAEGDEPGVVPVTLPAYLCGDDVNDAMAAPALFDVMWSRVAGADEHDLWLPASAVPAAEAWMRLEGWLS